MRFMILLLPLLALSACAESIKDRQRKPTTSTLASVAGETCYNNAFVMLDKEMTVQAALRRP